MGKEIDVRVDVEGLTSEPLSVDIRKLNISEDIDTEIDTAARHFAVFAILSEKADYRFQKMKLAFDNYCSDLKKELQSERQSGGVKPYSEAKLDTEIKYSDKYRAYKAKLIKFEHERNMVKGLAKAYEIRCTMVQSKSANRRAERGKLGV